MSELITISRPYAQALFEVAVSKNARVEWQVYLKNLAAVASHKEVQQLLISPNVGKASRVACFTKLVADLPAELDSLLQLLADTNRLAVLPHIVDLFIVLCDQSQQIIQAELTAAKPVCSEFLGRLEKNISHRYQAQVIISTNVDKSLLGGGILRVGDDVIDVSLRTKLQKLTQAMLI